MQLSGFEPSCDLGGSDGRNGENHSSWRVWEPPLGTFPSDGRKLPVTCGRSLRRWVVGTFDAVSGGRGCLTSWSRSAMLCSGARGIRFEFRIPTRLTISVSRSRKPGPPRTATLLRSTHFVSTAGSVATAIRFTSPRVVSVNSTIVGDARDPKLFLETSASHISEGSSRAPNNKKLTSGKPLLRATSSGPGSRTVSRQWQRGVAFSPDSGIGRRLGFWNHRGTRTGGSSR